MNELEVETYAPIEVLEHFADEMSDFSLLQRAVEDQTEFEFTAPALLRTFWRFFVRTWEPMMKAIEAIKKQLPPDEDDDIPLVVKGGGGGVVTAPDAPNAPPEPEPSAASLGEIDGRCWAIAREYKDKIQPHLTTTDMEDVMRQIDWDLKEGITGIEILTQIKAAQPGTSYQDISVATRLEHERKAAARLEHERAARVDRERKAAASERKQKKEPTQ